MYADDILLYHPISTNDDYLALQDDIDALGNWASLNTMTFNTTKCKHMLISRKKNRHNSAPPLTLNGCTLEKVPTFKYLGILITSNLTWSPHIQNLCRKARKIIGLIYRRYYRHTNSGTLIQLYTSLVRPHLEYAAPLWDPHLVHDIHSIESVQKFALRVCSKRWDYGYSELLEAFNIPSLESRRTYLKLCHLYKILHGLCYFPENIVNPRSNSTHSSRPHMLHQPFAHTNSFYSTFILDAI